MIVAVATVLAPLEDLVRFVAYHRNTGVDHLYLFIDDPDDPAAPALSRLQGVTATPCTAEHWRGLGLTPHSPIEVRQAGNATLALAWSRARGADWLVHVDADELIHTPQDDLAAWLARQPPDCDAVQFLPFEAVPRARPRRHVFEDCHLFKTTPDDRRLELARRAGCRQALRYGHFRSHTLGKAATRIAGRADTVGIHAPSASSGETLRVQVAEDAAVLHYDGCTFEAWREKWSRRKAGPGVLTHMRPGRRQQLSDFLAAEALGSPAAMRREYRRQCLIPPYEMAVLRGLGLVRSVRPPRTLFDHQPLIRP